MNLLRRRRVAKRYAKLAPLFAVEFMQPEFPGYSYQQFEEDICRKKYKRKSFRRVKTFRFDWDIIRKHAPALWEKCIYKTPTKAVLRIRGKHGNIYQVHVFARYWNENQQCKLDTLQLINLWNSNVHEFLKHPAITMKEEKEDLF